MVKIVKILKIWVEIINVHIGKKRHFLFYKYCSTYTLKFFTADIWCSPLLFANVYIVDSPTYRRVAWPPRYHRLPSRITFRKIDRSFKTYYYNCMSMNHDVNVCKEQQWAPNIRGEEFQRVGRTIFINIYIPNFFNKLCIILFVIRAL